jgi:hypothetical protein
MSTLQASITPNQLQRVIKDFSLHAGETVVIEFFDNDIYAYGSELACYKLAYKFRGCNVKVDYSENLQTWFFAKYDK